MALLDEPDPRRESSLRSLRRLVLLALVLGVVLNWPALAPLWRGGGAVPAAAWTGIAVGLTLCWLMALSPSRVVSYLALPPMLVLGAAYVYYALKAGIVVNEHLFAGIFQTQPGEVREFFNGTTTTLLVLTILAAWLVSATLHRRRPSASVRWTAAVLGFVGYLGTSVFATPAFARNGEFFPYNVHRGLAKYLDIRAKTRERLLHKTDLAKAYPSTLRADASDDLIVVVVLGESARGDHLQVNGYARETTPELAKLPNLVSLADVWSCGGMTSRSVPCMLTRATPDDLEVSDAETSFISILRARGFDTTWVAADGRAYEWTIPINTLAEEAEHVFFTEENAELLRRKKMVPECVDGCDGFHLPQVLEAIQRTEGGGRTFVLMQTHGSHLEHRQRRPQGFAKYQPECEETFENVRRCSIEQVVNGYDNTVLYTDDVLRRIIRSLEHRNALFFYVADHGQHLGENGHFFHGYLVPDHAWAPLRRVPWVVWASDRFVQLHPGPMANIRANRTRALSHDHLFHSVLDCAGVDSPAIDRAMSICAPGTRERASPPPGAEREEVKPPALRRLR